MNEIRLYRHELESMPEYSSSIPTGTTLWKMWRRREYSNREDGLEYVGQYVPPSKPVDRRGRELVGIRWFRVVLKHGPATPIFIHPDWDNYERYQRERCKWLASGK